MIVIVLIRKDAGELYAKLSYDPQKNYLLMKWIGSCSEDEVKKASMKMYDWQKREGLKKGCKFHVHDTKEIEGAWAGLVDWISNHFFPLNYEYGLRYNISVISPDLFSKLSSIELQKRSNDMVNTVLCETISQAEAWLTKRYAELSQ